MNNIKIFIDGDELSYDIITFSGGERHVQLDLDTLPDTFTGIRIISNLTSSESIIDLLLLNNALKHHFKRYLFVDLHIPYLPYARQDRVCAKGQAFSIEVFASILNIMDIFTLTVWDCHSEAGLSTIKDAVKNIKMLTNVEAYEIINTSNKLSKLLKDVNTVLVIPDEGAKARANLVVDNIAPNIEIVQAYKNRNPTTGAITNISVASSDLSGKTCVIVDDIGDGLGTFLGISEELKKKNVENIILFVTHGIFSKGIDVCIGMIDEVYCSNSIPIKCKSFKTPIHVIEYG